jgi:uncharacterized membrane protein
MLRGLDVICGSAPPERLFSDVLPWMAALIGLIVIGTAALLWIKRISQSDGSKAEEGFTLHDLRRMHAAGELSDEEFASARTAMIQQVTQGTSENVESPDRDDPNSSED